MKDCFSGPFMFVEFWLVHSKLAGRKVLENRKSDERDLSRTTAGHDFSYSFQKVGSYARLMLNFKQELDMMQSSKEIAKRRYDYWCCRIGHRPGFMEFRKYETGSDRRTCKP